MSAKLDLSPGGVFDITLSDGSIISGKFSTWPLKKFCEKNGSEGVSAKLQTLPGFIEYLLFSVEGVSRKNKEPFSYTDVHACEWIDELGGLTGDLTIKLMQHSGGDSEEKKTIVTE